MEAILIAHCKRTWRACADMAICLPASAQVHYKPTAAAYLQMQLQLRQEHVVAAPVHHLLQVRRAVLSVLTGL